MEPAYTLVSYLGGAKCVAAIVGKHFSRVYRWSYPLTSREGGGGLIPAKDQLKIMEYCKLHEIDLVPADFFSHERLADKLANDRKRGELGDQDLEAAE